MLVLQYCIPENIYGSVYLKDFMDRFFEAGKSTYFIDPYTEISLYILLIRDDLINNSADVLVVKLII
jgi:hypothetical protein